jgi:hypothetical protein
MRSFLYFLLVSLLFSLIFIPPQGADVSSNPEYQDSVLQCLEEIARGNHYNDVNSLALKVTSCWSSFSIPFYHFFLIIIASSYALNLQFTCGLVYTK